MYAGIHRLEFQRAWTPEFNEGQKAQVANRAELKYGLKVGI